MRAMRLRRSWMLFCGAVLGCSLLFLATQKLGAGQVPGDCWNCADNPTCVSDAGCLGNCWCDDGVCR